MRWGMRRKRKDDGRVFFLFLGIVATAALAAFIMLRGAGPAWAPKVGAGPDLARLLPEGSRYDAELGVAAVPNAVVGRPAYVVGALREGRLEVSLVEAEAFGRGHDLRATLQLLPETTFIGLPGVRAVRVDAEGPSIVLVHASAAAGGEVVTLAQVDAGAISAVRIFDGAGAARENAYPYDARLQPPPVDVRDVTGDGVRELMVQEQTAADAYRVYRWERDRFVFDERLSWAFLLRGQIFPEPPTR